MKHITILVFAVFSMFTAQARAEPREAIKAMYPVVCVNAATLSETMNEFKELPFARGLSNNLNNAEAPPTSLVIFMNPKTKTWTIVERVNSDQYCIIAVGNKFEPVPTDIRDRVEQEQNQGQL